MTSRPRRNGTNPNGGRPRFDRSAAFAYYVALGPQRTKRAVAAEFQVSEQTIGKWSRLEDWDEKAEAIDAKAAAGATAKAERSLEERRARTILVAERARDIVLAAESASIDPNRALSALPALAKHEELMAGEATDRIDVADVREIVRAHHEAFMATIPPEFHERYAVELEARLAVIRARFPKDDEDGKAAA